MEHKAKDAEKVLGEPIPQELVDVMQHIILSHHGETSLGFGSARNPLTPEAIAVHMIENMDAKLMMSLSACRGEDVPDGNWTEYMKAFSGRLYRPDLAPADVPADVAEQKSDGNGQPMKISNPLFETSSQKR